MPCHDNVKFWLFIHFISARIIECMFFIEIVFPIVLIIIAFGFGLRNHLSYVIKNWLFTYEPEEGYSYLINIFKREIILILVYVYLSFLYTWIVLGNTYNTITHLTFLRWLMEALFIPIVFFVTIFAYYVQYIENVFDLYEASYGFVIILKVPLFVLMRYADYQPDSIVNRLQYQIFRWFCYSSSELNAYEKNIH